MQNKEDTKKAQEIIDAPCANDTEIKLSSRIMVRKRLLFNHQMVMNLITMYMTIFLIQHPIGK